jgi:DNA polymerase III delta prime subunit
METIIPYRNSRLYSPDSYYSRYTDTLTDFLVRNAIRIARVKFFKNPWMLILLEIFIESMGLFRDWIHFWKYIQINYYDNNNDKTDVSTAQAVVWFLIKEHPDWPLGYTGGKQTVSRQLASFNDMDSPTKFLVPGIYYHADLTIISREDAMLLYPHWRSTLVNVKKFVEDCCHWYTQQKEKILRSPSGYYIITPTGVDHFKDIGRESIQKNWQNMFLESTVKDEIYSLVKRFLKNEELYKSRGIAYKKGFLLYGPPGTGKSSLIFAVANEFKFPIFNISLKTLAHSSQAIRKIPKYSIIAIDDFDVSYEEMKSFQKGDKNISERIPQLQIGEWTKVEAACSFQDGLLELYKILDGYIGLHGCIIFMTANDLKDIPDVLIRSGRMDHKYYMGYITSEVLEQIMQFFGLLESIRINIRDDFNRLPVDHKLTTSTVINEIFFPYSGTNELMAAWKKVISIASISGTTSVISAD